MNKRFDDSSEVCGNPEHAVYSNNLVNRKQNKLIIVPQVFGCGVLDQNEYVNLDNTVEIRQVYFTMKELFGAARHKVENDRYRDSLVAQLKFPIYDKICLSSEQVLVGHPQFHLLGFGAFDESGDDLCKCVQNFNDTMADTDDKRTARGLLKEYEAFREKFKDVDPFFFFTAAKVDAMLKRSSKPSSIFMDSHLSSGPFVTGKTRFAVGLAGQNFSTDVGDIS